MTTLSDLILEGSRPVGAGQLPQSRIADAFNQLPQPTPPQSAAQDNPFAEFVTPPAEAQNPFAEFVAPQEPDVLTDVAKSGGVGLAKGAIGVGGLPGDIRGLAGTVAEKLGAPASVGTNILSNVPMFGPALRFAPSSADIQKLVEKITGKFYEPKTTAGKFAQTIGEMVPAAIAGPGGVARRLATQAVLPGLASEAAGQATEGTAAEGPARIAGAMLTPAALAGARKIITPNNITAQREAARAALAAEGIETTAGQALGKKKLQYKEDIAGSYPEFEDRQFRQLTNAVATRFGEAGDNIHEAVQRARPRIGAQFDSSTQQMKVHMDPQLGNDLQQVSASMLKEGLDPNQIRRVTAQLDNVTNAFNTVSNGAKAPRTVMPGTAFHNLVKTGSPLMRVIDSTDAALSHYGNQIREALFNAAERTAYRRNTKPGGPSQKPFEDFQEARRQWSNMRAVEKASSGAGSVLAGGVMTPAAVRRAAIDRDASNYARGRGDFADLARHSNMLMPPLPNSGTAQRSRAYQIPSVIGGALAGGLMGHAVAPGVGASIGGSIGAALGPKVQGAAVMSRPVQRYFRNTAMPRPPQGTTRMRGLLTLPVAAHSAEDHN